MTDEYLIDKGFNKYERTEFQDNGIECNFQKCYYNADGSKKFFIDVAKWNYKQYKNVPFDYKYEISCQLYSYGTHEAIDITFHEESIESAELFVNELFINGFVEPYE